MLGKVLVRYLKPSWPFVVGVLVFEFLQALGSLYLPTLNADIINNGVVKGDVPYVWHTGLWMLLIAFLQVVASISAIFFGTRAATRLGLFLRRDVFRRVSAFSEREVSEFGPGSLITRNTNDVQQVQMVTQLGATMLVSSPMLVIGGIIMALRQDAGLSWLIWIAAPFVMVIIGAVTFRLVPLFRSFQGKMDALNRVLREQLTGIRVVRAFVREDIERERFRKASEDLASVGMRIGVLFVLVFPLAMLAIEITSVAVIWFGGIQIDAGQTQIGTLLAYMAYLTQILMGVIMVSFLTTLIPRAAVSAERIQAVLDTDSSLTEPEHPVTELSQPGRLEFDRASYAYPGADQPVLDHVSAVAEPGTTLAIIGSTGSGKTTLLSLVPRLFDVTSGSVRLGGVDVRELALETISRSIGYVPQRPYLFGGTVASNLQFGHKGATEAQMWRALEIAQAADFVREMPGQLQAPISQGGTNISGGQRQRLSIARAIIHEPQLLLFDDSFSALDLATDARLREALWRELPGVTKFVVAQRVSSIVDADRILVLEGGQVVGDGTHETLLETSSVYREIVDSQLGAEAAK